MRLQFKQRMFTWFDSYNIFDEYGNVAFTVKGQLSWGHCLKVFDCYGQELGMVKEKVITLLPKFEVYAHGGYLGCIKKELTFFIPKYDIDYNGWHVEGNIFEWDYSITSPTQGLVATVSKQLFHLTDQYVIDVANPQDALTVLMFVLAIDAEKCSRR